MPEYSKENLSEVLFKPRRTSIETSFIANSLKELPEISKPENIHFSKWYRQIHLAYWGWLGFDLIEVQAALARMAVSQSKRTREGIIDTVYAYGPGNWVYEFSMIADKYAKIGNEMLAKFSSTDNREEQLKYREEVFKNYRLADLYFDLASYPHLPGDELGSQALTQHYVYYRKASLFAPGDFEELKVPVGKRQTTIFIHTPDKTKMHPCVIVLSNYVNLATEYLRFYREKLAPNGIALVVVDMPAIGLNAHIPLDPIKTSNVHEAVVDYIYEHVPYINRSKIGILAQRLGGNCAVHLLLTRHDRIASAFIVGPTLHEYFTNRELLDSTPSMLRAVVASRINSDAAQWNNIIPQFQVLSVKRQGVLRGFRIDVPIKVIGIKGDFLSPKSDIELLSGFSSKIDIEFVNMKNTLQVFGEVMDEATKFFIKTLL
jgi:esterase FrsA